MLELDITKQVLKFFRPLPAKQYRQVFNKVLQIIQVARQAVHAVHHHRIVFAHERRQRVELGPLYVLAGRLVDKDLIGRDVFELPFRVLIESAHPDVADAMTQHVACES